MSIAANIQEFDNSQISAMAWMFAPGVIRELAYSGQSPRLARLVKLSKIDRKLTALKHPNVRDAFEAAYDEIRIEKNRCAYYYKNLLTHNTLKGVHDLNIASILTEYRIGGSKADVVVLNGTSTAYEIKSERDSLGRLKGQITSYLSVFDKVYVFTGSKYIKSLLDILPDKVGILTIDPNQRIFTIREALSNKSAIDPAVLFDSLTRSEAGQVLQLYGIPTPDAPNTRIRGLLRALFIQLGAEKAHDGTLTVLKKSRSISPLRDLLDELPISLQAACIGIQLPVIAKSRFLDSLGIELSQAYNWT